MSAAIAKRSGEERNGRRRSLLAAARDSQRRGPPYIGVVGHGADLERPGGVAWLLRGLGAEVRTIGLHDDPNTLVEDHDAERGVHARAVVIDAMDRLDKASRMLHSLRADPTFRDVAVLLVTPNELVTRVEPSVGFDDFVVPPLTAEELYARIRRLEWRRSEFVTEERYKVGALVVDRARSDVTVNGVPVSLTAKELALLAYFCEQRGKVLSRPHLLARVWGDRYEGGPRTVDIHVRRLRAKLGAALPLDTLRRWGYRLREP